MKNSEKIKNYKYVEKSIVCVYQENGEYDDTAIKLLAKEYHNFLVKLVLENCSDTFKEQLCKLSAERLEKMCLQLDNSEYWI